MNDTVMTTNAITESRGSVTFDPKLMEVGRPYPFRFLDDWHVAVKREDGTLDTYSLPEPHRRRLTRWLRSMRGGE
jgi:hypothetical protein